LLVCIESLLKDGVWTELEAKLRHGLEVKTFVSSDEFHAVELTRLCFEDALVRITNLWLELKPGMDIGL
jgi:hypothetical protein